MQKSMINIHNIQRLRNSQNYNNKISLWWNNKTYFLSYKDKIIIIYLFVQISSYFFNKQIKNSSFKRGDRNINKWWKEEKFPR